jgi:tetratricopeptide (TPR) repeat protein
LTFTPGDIRLMHQGLDFRDARPARTAATAFSFAPQTIPPDYICRDGAESRNPPPRAIGDDGKPTPEFQAWLDGSAQPSCAGQPATSAPATVSVQTLRRKVSGKAMGEFRRGMEVFRKGDFTAAAKLFEDAARRSPVFVDARAYAGLAYVRLGQFAEAVRSYQQAVDLEPANAPLLSNLASALLQVHRPEEGELAARRALKAAPDSSEAHYMLGLALVAQEKELDEADSHLALAEEKYPRARMVRDWIRNASTASKQSAQ